MHLLDPVASDAEEGVLALHESTVQTALFGCGLKRMRAVCCVCDSGEVELESGFPIPTKVEKHVPRCEEGIMHVLLAILPSKISTTQRQPSTWLFEIIWRGGNIKK